MPIDDLYVPSSFIRVPKKKRGEPSALAMETFLSAVYRAVLLGNPGGGKSTFALKLCHDLAASYERRIFAGRLATPVLVILRDYGAEKKARGWSILQFMEGTANSKYQVQPPQGGFEYLLLNGRVVVIFDGLDELLDTSYRQEIGSDVESFCTLYPSVPVLVTSREVDYEQAPLDEKRFELFRLSDFNEAQVRQYSQKWFALDTELTPEQQSHKGATFLEESHAVSDLRANPLMLALMCNIYRGANYIPRNRPDVYEKCATMLFEQWDKSRGILVSLPFEAHISQAIKYLAYWIYSDGELQGGVTESQLIAKAADYLCSWRFEDRAEAEKAARDFISFCRGRAWVFTDTGTRKEGERLYQFTHRTFLEYFSAAHLIRTHATPSRLETVLLPRIGKREWDVVSQLAFQLQNKNVEGAGDTLLTDLTKKARRSRGPQRWNLLSFAARCLQFMVPRPKVTRDVATAGTEHCLLEAKQFRPPDPDWRFPTEASNLLSALLRGAVENRSIVAGAIESLLVECVCSRSEREGLAALEIGLNFDMACYGSRGRQPERDLLDFWATVSDRIFDASPERVRAICEEHFGPCFDAVRLGRVSIRDFVEWHGTASLFRGRSYAVFPNLWGGAVADRLLYGVLFAAHSLQRSRDRKILESNLEEMGRVLLSSAVPWVGRQGVHRGLSGDSMLLEEHFGAGDEKAISWLNGDTLFALFGVLATALESIAGSNTLKERLMNSRNLLFALLRNVFLARLEPSEALLLAAEREIERTRLTKDQRDFVWRWTRGEISLVRTAGRGRGKAASG